MVSGDLKKVLADCYANSRMAAKVLYPERFYRPFDPIYDRIFSLVDDFDKKKKVLAAPRGLGKTSIANLLIPSKRILFKDRHYIVIVSYNHKNALQKSENLKRELVGNDIIRKLYGDITTDNWSKERWVVDIDGWEVCVQPLGIRQEIRGQLFKSYRPDLIICDDIETQEMVRSADRRESVRKWFYGDLLNSVDRGVDDWEVIFLGTVHHQEALLVKLLESEDWHSRRLEICDDDYNTKAPNFMTTEQVKELAQAYRDANELDVFFMEYRNQPVPIGETAFREEYFQYYDEVERQLDQDMDVENLVVVDVARTVQAQSSESAVVGFGYNRKTNEIFIREIIHGHFYPEQLFEKIFVVADRIGANILGVEVTGLREFVTYPIRNEIKRRGSTLQLIELHARGGKNEKGKIKRIKSLVPFYRQGLIKHNPRVVDPLESQLLMFPKASKWDVMDATGYIPALLEKGERYMQPVEADDVLKSPERVEAEYDDLYKEYQEEEVNTLDEFRLFT